MTVDFNINPEFSDFQEKCPICLDEFKDHDRVISTHNGKCPIHNDCLLENITHRINDNNDRLFIDALPICCPLCRRRITHVNGIAVEQPVPGNPGQVPAPPVPGNPPNERRNTDLIFKVAFATASILIGGLAGYGITNAAISASFIPQAFSTGTMVLGACFGATSAALNFFKYPVKLLPNAFITTAVPFAVGYATAGFTAKSAYRSVIDAAWSDFTSAKDAAWSTLTSAQDAAGSAYSSAKDAAWSDFTSANNDAGSTADSTRDAAWSTFQSSKAAAWSDFTSANDAAVSVHKSALDAASSSVHSYAMGTARSAYQSALDAARSAYQSALEAAASAHNSAQIAARSVYQSALDAAGSTYNFTLDAADSVRSTSIDAAESVRSSAIDAAESVRSSAIDAATSDYNTNISLNTIARLSSVFAANFIVGGAIGLSLRKVYNNFTRA